MTVIPHVTTIMRVDSEFICFNFEICLDQVSRAVFLRAVVYYHQRPATFDILGLRPRSSSTRDHDPRPSPTSNTTTGSSSEYNDSVQGGYDNTSSHNSHHDSGHDDKREHYTSYNFYANKIEDYISSKFHHFLDIIDEHIDDNNKTKNVTHSEDLLLENFISMFSYELRVTLVWAPSGSRTSHPTQRTEDKVTVLQEWVTSQVIPDVIILGKLSLIPNYLSLVTLLTIAVNM